MEGVFQYHMASTARICTIVDHLQDTGSSFLAALIWRNGTLMNSSTAHISARTVGQRCFQYRWPLLEIATDKLPIRCTRSRTTISTDSLVTAATTAMAGVSLMYQLRLLCHLVAQFQVLDEACGSISNHCYDDESRLRLWRVLHQPFTDQIVAVLQAIEKNVESHQLLYEKGFMKNKVGKPQNWATTGWSRPRLKISSRLAPRTDMDDQQRREQVTDVIEELSIAIAKVLAGTREAAEKELDTIKRVIGEAFERFSI